MSEPATRQILLIHSEAKVREKVAACLSHCVGWYVCSTDFPSKGLQLAAAVQPDVILFDLSVFGMNFIAFAEQLKPILRPFNWHIEN